MRLSKPEDSYCSLPKHVPINVVCAYIIENVDECEGGGYLQWTRYVMCEHSQPLQILFIILAVIWLFMLFVAISVVADDFFSTCVSAISSHMRMSESLAGVTLVAFANGSPDVFSSIASVLSSGTPKTGLAMGFLLGGVLYIILVVLSAIILVKPFRATRRPMTRDYIFWLISISLVLFFFFYDTRLHFWEPLNPAVSMGGFSVLVGVYLAYVITVALGTIWTTRRPKVSTVEVEKPATITFLNVEIVIDGPEKSPIPSFISATSVSSSGMLVPPSPDTVDDVSLSTASFNDDDEAEDVQVIHNHVVISGKEARRKALLKVARKRITSTHEFFKEMILNLQPFTAEDWKEENWYWKPLLIAKAIPIILMKATIPLTESGWSKPSFLLQIMTAPTFVAFCLQELTWVFIKGGPGFFVIPLTVSVVVVVILLLVTRSDIEPIWWRPVTPYLGFIMSIAWIYMIAAEVISVISMLGVLSGIQLEILGATIIAWSNCMGDLFSDTAIARQGYPRMAASAAIGGPLFNLLIGFGVPFTIAAIRDPSRSLPLDFTPVTMLLVSFLAAGISLSLIAVLIQRFRLRRLFAFLLLSLYVAFLILILLTETKIIKFV